MKVLPIPVENQLKIGLSAGTNSYTIVMCLKNKPAVLLSTLVHK